MMSARVRWIRILPIAFSVALSPRTRSEGHSKTSRRAALLAVFLMVVLTVLPSGAANAATIPTAPQNLAASAGNGQNSLSWTNGGAAITSYRVFRGTTSSNRQIVTSGGCANLGAVLSCTDTGLTNGQSYDYIVSAVNSVGQGAPSNSAIATPAPALSITTTSLPSATVGTGYGQGLAASGGQTPYTWSVSSGLPPGLAIYAGLARYLKVGGNGGI